MIEIRNCSKAFGEIHAIDHVLMEIGERQIFRSLMASCSSSAVLT